jgi:hypothetical protein
MLTGPVADDQYFQQKQSPFLSAIIANVARRAPMKVNTCGMENSSLIIHRHS